MTWREDLADIYQMDSSGIVLALMVLSLFGSYEVDSDVVGSCRTQKSKFMQVSCSQLSYLCNITADRKYLLSFYYEIGSHFASESFVLVNCITRINMIGR